ncbi:hypothetical protein [Hyphomicrobium sp.]|uniref:hypothetical protein n=1 Tax=Hyphomicrobium sp. TaxID=82 RepID=UPI0025BC0B3A|nr:hypothetical protein [Hyphomicrobium sp.]MCC7251840.1 hypothetical protein [Hyphomicrobium sp.]
MTKLQSTDPVVELGRQIAELEARYEELEDLEHDARNAKDLSAEGYYEAARLDVYSRIEALKGALSCYEAKTLVGAMIQVAQVWNMIDFLLDADEAAERKRLRQEAERLIVSALRVIEREAGTDFNALGLGAYRNANLDPWTPVEDRLAAIKALAPEAKAA